MEIKCNNSNTECNADYVVINMEDESFSEEKEWTGDSMEVIYRGKGPWSYENSTICPSKYHTVMYQLPATLNSLPKAHHKSSLVTWKTDYVRMPFSSKNVMIITGENGEEFYKPRWEVIEQALLQPILNSKEFEQAIHSYHTRKAPFFTLHHLFEDLFEEEETYQFFNNVLPNIVQLALQLPTILPGGLPLLKHDATKSISLSQQQIACLLANAFLCTFPWHKDSLNYPGINFNRLYEGDVSVNRFSCVVEKLKCICHYFRRVCSKIPSGVVTFKRKSLFKSQIPRWDRLTKEISSTKLHISSTGTIEGDGLGLLQVDFANCIVGGGVLHLGCVQEEIRFIICPELIISRLFTEKLGPNEALLVIGAERYSNYSGYGDTFVWAGDHQDETPYDSCCRRKTSVVAIDATHFHKPSQQFECGRMLREINKAYVGFHARGANEDGFLPAVATGNWGCGAFRGDPYLKSLLQIMACTAARRDVVYFTFGDEDLRDRLQEMYGFLSSNHVTVAQLWKYLSKFNVSGLAATHLFSYIYQAHVDENQKPITKYFMKTKQTATTSTNESPETSPKKTIEDVVKEQVEDLVIESSQTETKRVHIQPISETKTDSTFNSRKQNTKRFNADEMSKNHERIVSLIDILDGKSSINLKANEAERCSESLLSAVDEYQEEKKIEAAIKRSVMDCIMDDDDVLMQVDLQHCDNIKDDKCTKQLGAKQKITPPKEKISDYFMKIEKG